MRLFSLTKYVRSLSVPQKFYTLIALTILILIIEVGSFWLVMGTMSSIRAYVGGEGLWSKAQKESVNSLLRYASTHNEADYEQAIAYLKVPEGDSIARVELQKKNPDLALVRQGFLDGDNHPDDFDGMIFLFRNFGSVSYMKQAIEVWTRGDSLIKEQKALGAHMHEIIVGTGGASNISLALVPLVQQLVALDVRLTVLENQFSSVLGEGSRKIGFLLFSALLVLTIVFGLLALFVALFISRLVTQVDTAKSEFVALVSHQLRTPLSVIKLSAEMLGKADSSKLTHYEQRALSNISHEVVQMASLIDTILDVSRIELGTLLIAPKRIDIMEVAHTAAAEAHLAARDKHMHIVEEYEPASLVVPMDPALFRIILQNLLSNAVKYSPEGSTVELSVTKTQSAIRICVSDRGYGIPEEKQRHIFSKLYRAGTVAGEDPGGSGLGLYIVKSIVRAAGGTIWFESVVDKGSSFYVEFPSEGMESRKGNVRM